MAQRTDRMAAAKEARVIKAAISLLSVFALQLFHGHSAHALDIIGYTNRNGCDGDAIGCYGAGANLCCVLNRASVRFASLGNCQTGVIFSGNGCQNTIDSRSGPLNVCFQNYNAAAGRWFSSCRASSQEKSQTCGTPELQGEDCTATTLPNAVFHTVPGSSNGTWVLQTGSDNVEDTLSQLQAVPLNQKVAWFQSKGASFTAKEDDLPMTVVDGSKV